MLEKKTIDTSYSKAFCPKYLDAKNSILGLFEMPLTNHWHFRLSFPSSPKGKLCLHHRITEVRLFLLTNLPPMNPHISKLCFL